MEEKIDLERWKKHSRFPKYGRSTYGRIYSYYYLTCLKPQKTDNGYLRVKLITKNNNTIQMFVHRLVLETFVGLRPKGYICRHYPDQNKTNNFLNNISWDTASVNNIDRIENGTFNCATHSVDEIIEIKEKLKNGVHSNIIIKEYNMSKEVISNIKNNNVWKTIGEDISKYNHTFKRKKLTSNDSCLIKILLRDTKLPQYEIADMFNVHQSSISNIKNNKHFGDIKTPNMTYEDACVVYNKGDSLVT